MLLNIITDSIAPQPDMEIVGQGAAPASLAETAESTNADVVIVASDGVAEDDEYDEILYGHSRRKVLRIFGQGRHGSLYELRPCHIPLGEMSLPRLLDSIRGSLGPAAGAD